MYLAHFELDERPFSITPDPRFVYLTMRHREALAHLLYGLGEGGGFVQLTGEVGTGKTTICRTLLRQLPEHVDAALIFNPQLTVPDLLESICTELHIDLPTEHPSIKVLSDRLYSHLLDANARRRRTVLIIDEAQNLSPEVLEEVRLLTNLETDDAKLLQVFLIGQPELRSLLAKNELRQLRQRITARYHLEPLDPDETRHYIRHRLSVAGCDRGIFTRRAVRRVYRLTGGIPRRINILCDRALLGAYTTSAERVNGAIVARASKEIEGGRATAPQRLARYATVAVAVMAVTAVAGLVLRPADLPVSEWIDRASAALGSRSPEQPARVGDPPPSGEAEAVIASVESAEPAAEVIPLPDGELSLSLEPAQMPELPAEPAPPATPSTPASPPPPSEPPAAVEPLSPSKAAVTAEPQPLSADEVIAAIDGDGWLQAVLGLSKLWRVPPPSAGASLCDWARAQDLECHSKPASWPELRAFDLPAVLELVAGQDAAVHLLLFGLSGDEAMVLVDGREQRIARAELEGVWRGEQVLLWRPSLGGNGSIRLGQTGERVRWLRDALGSIDGGEASSGDNERFDAALLERVKAFQRERGLDVDGIVGPQTFVHLNLMASREGAPSLAAATDAGGRAWREASVAMEAR
ncbi:MAG TPA: AAA family ATPase [Gammaproteobacteria bacterium]|nr:AAA family ATPase [Gammaproteobacteria bacterium]